MSRLLIIRPERGASATAARARAAGLEPHICSLFEIEPVAWTVPDVARFDALLLTSANALGHGGSGLAALTGLPVVAVGEATAEAARGAGFEISMTGTVGVQGLLDAIPDTIRLLHLCGEDRTDAASSHHIEAVTVYRAAGLPAPDLPDLAGWTIAVHSSRAGARLAELVEGRSATAVAAISEAAARSCGGGWRALEWPGEPTDSALLALAARLCQSRGR